MIQLAPGDGSELIAAGTFTQIGALAASRIARWDGAAWHALGAGLPGMPTAIARDATRIYASTYDEGAGMYLLGAFDGAAWTELATPAAGITPVPWFSFVQLVPIAGGLIAVGTAERDDHTGRGAFVYSGGELRPIGGGVHATMVTGVAATSDAVWFAGGIAEAGGATPISTVGVARYQLAR